MEHPALIVGAPDKFAVHLTDLTDFAPLRSGKNHAPVRAARRRRAARGDAGRAALARHLRPVARVQATGRVRPHDLGREPAGARQHLRCPGSRVYASAAEAPKEEGGEAAGITFLKEQQWKTPGFAHGVRDERRRRRRSFEASGRDRARSRADGAQVSAPDRRTGRRERRWRSPRRRASGCSGARCWRCSRRRSARAGQRVRRGARASCVRREDEHERAKRLYAVEAVPAAAACTRPRFGSGGARGARGRSAGGERRRDRPDCRARSDRRRRGDAHASCPAAVWMPGAALFTVVDPSVVWLR